MIVLFPGHTENIAYIQGERLVHREQQVFLTDVLNVNEDVGIVLNVAYIIWCRNEFKSFLIFF